MKQLLCLIFKIIKNVRKVYAKLAFDCKFVHLIGSLDWNKLHDCIHTMYSQYTNYAFTDIQTLKVH